jgi:hypothetical protein
LKGLVGRILSDDMMKIFCERLPRKMRMRKNIEVNLVDQSSRMVKNSTRDILRFRVKTIERDEIKSNNLDSSSMKVFDVDNSNAEEIMNKRSTNF